MHLIERYILRRTLALSMLTLVSTTVMVLITQVLIYVNVLTASGQAIVTFFLLAGTLVPAMVNVVFPFALYIGATQTLTTMNSDSELAVIESAGGTPWLVGRPVVVISLCMAVISVFLSQLVEPWAGQNKRDILVRASADLISVAVKSGSFQRIQDGLYLQIAEQLPSGGYGGIFIADSREPNSELLYFARRGDIGTENGTDVLALEDGEIHRKSIDSGELSIIRFNSYVVNLNLLSAGATSAIYYPADRSTYFLMFGDPNDDYFKRNRPQDIRTELHKRFSDWMYPIAFGLIAVFFTSRARSNRQEQLWNMSAGGALAIAIRGLGFYAMNKSGGSPFFAVLVYAIPLATIIVFASLIAAQKSVLISMNFIDTVTGFVTRWIRRLLPESVLSQLPGFEGPR